MFHPISVSEKHVLFQKLGQSYAEFSSPASDSTCVTEQLANGEVILSENRPGLLVSSTSWTEDEDFSILFDALEGIGKYYSWPDFVVTHLAIWAEYERTRCCDRNYPRLLCVITGKGPLKEYYLELIGKKSWQHIDICTPWLEAEDYPKLIGISFISRFFITSLIEFAFFLKK